MAGGRSMKAAFRMEVVLAQDRVKVVHLVSGLDVGGAERLLLLSARHHDRRLFQMTIVSLMTGGALVPQLRDLGVEVLEMGQRRGSLSPAGVLKLIQVMRGLDPDILQGHMFHSNLLVRLAKPFLPRTVVLSTRHTDHEPRARRLLNRLTAPLGAGTIVFSQRVAQAERREIAASRPVYVVPYGVELPVDLPDRSWARKRLDLDDGTFLWLAAGRLSPEKGFDRLLEAAAGLAGTIPFVLIVAGDGPAGDVLKSRARSLGLENTVRFPGVVQDLAPLFGAADAFVLSSLWEGGPMVVAEAMAHGLPVLATEVGDTPAMVSDGETGLLVPPGDAAALTAAMARMMDMRQDLPRWGAAGRRRVKERFDFGTTQARTVELYRQVLERNTGDPA